MKKSLIALAVASAVSAPAFAATSNVDVYGFLHIAVEDTNVSGQDMAVVDRVSRLGFKGSEDLGGGLAALWQVETALGSASTGGSVGGSTSLATRDTFLGLKSNSLGTVLVGRLNTPYKNSTGKLDLFADTAADYNLGGMSVTRAAVAQIVLDAGGTAADVTALENVIGTKGLNYGYINATHDLRSPAAIAYASPDFSGLNFAAAAVATNSASSLNSGDQVDAYSLSANYANGPLMLAAGYQKAKALDSKAWKLGAGYSFGNAQVGVIYEDNEVLGLDAKTWLLNGAYTMGAITLKAQYAKNELDDLDAKMWALGADYALSKRTTVYALYTADKADRVDYGVVTVGTVTANDYFGSDDNIKTFGVGVKHSF